MSEVFKPNQKVVCIDDRFPSAVFECYDDVPRRGGVYTVSEVQIGRDYRTAQYGPGIRLKEIPPIVPNMGSFSSWRFRALQTQQAEKTMLEAQRV